MSTMKKLIDQTDFQNIHQLSKKWKKDNKDITASKFNQPQRPQNTSIDFHSETTIPLTKNKLQSRNIDPQHQSQYIQKISQSNASSMNSHNPHISKKRNVVPQVIDEDTQHFKNRLEHLLNTFKTDAVSQFMGMKKSMLQYQKDCVKSDTQKYLIMYEQKHQQLIQTRQKLIEMTKQAEKKTIQCDQMANFISKLNQRIRITRYLSRPFALLYENKQRQKMYKFKMSEAQKHDNKRLKYKALKGWMNEWKSNKQQRKKQSDQKRIQMQVNSIVGKFQKQMQMLKQQLFEAKRKNQEFQNNKVLITQNLKKAFLRGMCSMNMQAMSLLGDQNILQKQDFPKKENQQLLSNISYMDTHTHNHTAHKFNIDDDQHNYMQNKSMINPSSSNNIIFMNQVKAQSKDHKWKEAPIMGIQQKRDYQQPRQFNPPQMKTQNVKPTNQGKVIRIVDGKSAVEKDVNSMIGSKRPVQNQRSIATSNKKKINQ